MQSGSLVLPGQGQALQSAWAVLAAAGAGWVSGNRISAGKAGFQSGLFGRAVSPVHLCTIGGGGPLGEGLLFAVN